MSQATAADAATRRRSETAVSSDARAAAPEGAPRRQMARAASSSARATDSSGPVAASARCHARRSGESARAAARERCAPRRSLGDARCTIAARSSGYRNDMWPSAASTWTRSARCAGARSSTPAESRAAFRIVVRQASAFSAATSSTLRVGAGSLSTAEAKAVSSRPERARNAGSGSWPERCRLLSAAGELLQRERIARGFGQQPPPYRRRQPGPSDVQQLGRRLCGKRPDLPYGQLELVTEALGSRSGGGKEDDRIVTDPADDEPQHGRAGTVDARHVVDDHQQRALDGDLAEQGEYRRRGGRMGPATVPGRDRRSGRGRLDGDRRAPWPACAADRASGAAPRTSSRPRTPRRRRAVPAFRRPRPVPRRHPAVPSFPPPERRAAAGCRRPDPAPRTASPSVPARPRARPGPLRAVNSPASRHRAARRRNHDGLTRKNILYYSFNLR